MMARKLENFNCEAKCRLDRGKATKGNSKSYEKALKRSTEISSISTYR